MGEPNSMEETEDAAAAVGIDRAAEEERVRAVLAEDCAGPLWKALIDELTIYAWPRLHGMIYKGTIGKVSTGTPHASLDPELHQLLRQSIEDRDELVTEALLWAPAKFREHLLAERWDPAKGKSLSSYYFGTVAAGFWASYQSWERRVAARRKALLAASRSLVTEADPTAVDLDLQMSQRSALRVILSSADPWQRSIAAAIFAGHTQVEAAQALGLSVGAVGVRMRGLRKTARRLAEAGTIDATLLPHGRSKAIQRGAA